MREGIRRIAVAMKVMAWLWLIGWMAAGAISAAIASELNNHDRVSNLTNEELFQQLRQTSGFAEKLKEARDAGYTDAEIREHLEKRNNAPKDKVIAANVDARWEDAPIVEGATQATPQKSWADRLGTFGVAALIGVVGFAVARTLAWILEGFAAPK